MTDFLALEELTAAHLNTHFNALENAWTTWVPTLTNLTLGNGTLIAKHRLVGETVNFVFKLTMGSTSAVGTDPSFTLPATPAAHYVHADFGWMPVGSCYFLDAVTTARSGLVGVFSGSTARMLYDNGTSPAVGITATVPWTWTTGDVLSAWGTYETA